MAKVIQPALVPVPAPAAPGSRGAQVQAENDALRAENRRLRGALARVRQQDALLGAEYAELLAHARASVALYATQQASQAATEQVDPLGHLLGFLEERGQLPPDTVTASALLAQAFARTADADELFRGTS